MSIIGKWKTKKMLAFGPDGMQLMTLDEAKTLDEETAEELVKTMTTTIVDINADGTVYTRIIIPADQIEEAKAQGAPLEADGTIIADRKPWKEENGEYFYDTGEQREIGGEAVSSWDKLSLDAEGYLPYASGMMLLEKAE